MTSGWAWLIFLGGVFHFGTLLASATVPLVLDWKRELDKLAPLMRQLVWVYGVFIVLTIAGFGLLSMLFANELAMGTSLARGVCAFVAVFWLVRLLVQFFVFDARPYLNRWFLRVGYHGLTGIFAYQVIVYGLAAVG